jgi:hypothetical protein
MKKRVLRPYLMSVLVFLGLLGIQGAEFESEFS